MGKLTATGFEKSTPTEIYDKLKAGAELYVPDFTTLPSEIRENLLQEIVQPCLQFEDMTNYLMNGISSSYANDEMFYNIGLTFGVKPKQYIKGQVTLNFTGVKGTLISAGTKASGGGITVETDNDTIINSTGEAYAIAYTEDNIIAIPPNMIDTMVTQISGVTSVTNNASGLAPIPAESIEDYKKAFYNAINTPRNGSLLSAYALLHEVKGVDSRLINLITEYQRINLKDYASINCIVGGGDDYEVAYALFQALWSPTLIIGKQSDDGTDRVVSVDLDMYGSSFNVKYLRPKLLQMNIKVNITLNEFIRNSSIVKGYLEPAFLSVINSLKIGISVTRAMLDDLVMDNLKVNGITLDYVNKIDYVIQLNDTIVGFDELSRLPIEYDEYLTLTAFDVGVTQ